MREHKGKSGIYKIRNKVNDKMYIGKTKCFYKRHCQYVSDVRNKTKDRINEYLMNSFLKYGFENFEFTVVEFCDVGDCAERELFWILHYNTLSREIGYNFRLDSSTGMIAHPDTSAKMSANLKLQWQQGMRDGHSEKLKASWENRNRDAQGKMFSEILTKYVYKVTFPDGSIKEMLYKELSENISKSATSGFYRNKSDKIKYKDLLIERIKAKGQT